MTLCLRGKRQAKNDSGAGKESDTNMTDFDNKAPKDVPDDFIRAAAEDLRITGNKGKAYNAGQPEQTPGPAKSPGEEKKFSPADGRRALWAPQPDKPIPAAIPPAFRNESQDDVSIGNTTHIASEGNSGFSRTARHPEQSPYSRRRHPVDQPSPSQEHAPYAEPSYHQEEPDNEQGFLGSLQPLRILRVMRRKWLTIFLLLILSLAGAWFYLSIVPKSYRATSLIELSLRRPRIMNQQSAVIEDLGYMSSEEIFNTRLARFNSGEMRELALTRFKAIRPSRTETDEQLRLMISKVTFTLVRKTKLVQVISEDNDKTNATALANACTEAAEVFSIEENRAASDKAVAWLEAQGRTQRDALDRAGQTIAEFRLKNNVDVIENQRKALSEATLDLNRTMVARETELVLVQDIVLKLNTLEINPETAGSLPDPTPRRDEISTIRKQLDIATTERDSLLIRYTPQHPEVIEKERICGVIRAQFVEAIRRGRETAGSNLALLQQQVESLRKKSMDLGKIISDLDVRIVQAESSIATLQRERDAFDQSYRGILNRIEEARLAADENTATIKIIDRASEPLAPFKPQIPRVIFLAVVVGLALGIGVALLADTLEDRVSSIDDVERMIGLRILGLVPHVPRALRADIIRSSFSDKRGHIAEVFAGIRVVLNSRQFSDQSHTMLVASPGPEDGKTVTSCNLAIAFAQGGMRTLLIDFDLRRPRIGKIFDIPDSSRRLAEVLTARDPSLFPGLICQSTCPDLHIAATRMVADINPSDIFGGEIVSEFIDWARSNYDRVVIDSAPFGAVSDCLVLASRVDSVILICRPVKTHKHTTRLMMKNLSDVGANIVGAIINDIDFKKHPYFGNYYHQHHDNYAYGDQEKRNSKPEAAPAPEDPKTDS